MLLWKFVVLYSLSNDWISKNFNFYEILRPMKNGDQIVKDYKEIYRKSSIKPLGANLIFGILEGLNSEGNLQGTDLLSGL